MRYNILVLVLEFPVWDRVIIHCSEKKMSNAREKSFSNWVVFQAFGKSDKKQWRGSFTCRKTEEGMDFDRARRGTWLAAQEVIENPLSSLGLENYWSPTKSARYGWKVKRSFWWPREGAAEKCAENRRWADVLRLRHWRLMIINSKWPGFYSLQNG